LDSENERRCFDVAAVIFYPQARMVVGDKTTHNGECNDVKQGHTPKDLLACPRDRFPRIGLWH
jgi:hypothetical protein